MYKDDILVLLHNNQPWSDEFLAERGVIYMLTGLSLLQRCNNQTERDEIPTTTMMTMKVISMMTIMQ